MPVSPRRTGAASVAPLTGLVLAAGLAPLAVPGRLRDAGLDFWAYPAAEADYRHQTGHGEKLDDHHRRRRVQVEVTHHLADELAAGRLSLAEAADELARLNDGRFGFAAGLGAAYPDAPGPRHRIARYAIDKGLHRLTGPDREAAAARLEAEYRALSGPE